jgi:hypothetical protein
MEYKLRWNFYATFNCVKFVANFVLSGMILINFSKWRIFMKTLLIIFHYLNRTIFGFESKEINVRNLAAIVLKWLYFELPTEVSLGWVFWCCLIKT